ncbi:uncharacterized protein LOC131858958 [Cryptomeria japonica]|uniref:uncharacterized protein LOC131858958 n=1 Tax=Cryptomeria japonica TaxID=3369 RepID=UPI0027DA44CD|nr:uncharacterized protein LOC131858958 [Cryptomeria japonica]
MKIIFWNVKGCNALDKRRLIKRGLDQLRPDVVFLQETKMDNGEEKSLLGSWKQWSRVFVDSEGASGGLGILWNANIHKVEEGLASNMWQVCKLHSYPLNVDFTIINVYGPCKSELQKRFRRSLSSLIRDLEGRLLIIEGDFNAILELSEKLGGKGEIPTNLAHFQNFVTKNGLREIKSKEGQFTWSNRRISG